MLGPPLLLRQAGLRNRRIREAALCFGLDSTSIKKGGTDIPWKGLVVPRKETETTLYAVVAQWLARLPSKQEIFASSSLVYGSICKISSAGQSAWFTPKRSQVRALYLVPRSHPSTYKWLQTQRGELFNARLEEF